jgi:dTDP-glucose pyrophosphorylase
MFELKGESVTDELIDYLADEDNPIDVKIAAINAVSIYKDVYTPLMKKLKNRWRTDSEITVLKEINASTHAALAYAKARENWFDLGEAYILGYSAFLKDSRSFTVNMVYALIVSTEILEHDFCEVFKICNSVISNNSLKQDMRPQAVSMMMEYIHLYEEYCK